MKTSPLTFCISTYNNLPYLKIAIDSVRKNSYFKKAPFIIHAENCTDGTDEWLKENSKKYNLEYYIDKNDIPLGIGGGMNFCTERVKTEYIMFLHSDFYVTKNWDKSLLDIFEKYPNKKMWVNSHRVEPNMFNSPQRYGTVIVPKEHFGAYYYDFDSEQFEEWAQEFALLNDFEIPKGEGVSGLIRKKDWDEIGGNDPIFAPTSWEDMDLFLRMLNEGFEFVLTSKSVVWHFGARGSHRLEENNGQSSERQMKAEKENAKKWLKKWGKMPIFDEYGMIKGIKINIDLKKLKNLDLFNLSKYIIEDEFRNYFLRDEGQEHYKLLAYYSTQYNNSTLLDIGTYKGCSALALSYNTNNKVVSFDITDGLKRLNNIPNNINFIVDDILDKKYVELILSSPFILLDTDHDGIFENIFYKYIQQINYKGLLILDDIKLNKPMIDFWNSINEEKYDLSEVGHQTGTGLIMFK